MTTDDLGQEGPFQSIDSAPKDGRLIIGREGSGDAHLMRWRTKDDMLAEDGPEDQGEHAYWARWRTDTGLDPVEWAPTRLTKDETLDRA